MGKVKFVGKEFDVPECIYIWEYEVLKNEEGEEEYYSDVESLEPCEDGSWMSCGQWKISQEEAESMLSYESSPEPADYNGVRGASIEGLWLDGREIVINIGQRKEVEIIECPIIHDLADWAGWKKKTRMEYLTRSCEKKSHVFSLEKEWDKHKIVVKFRPEAEIRGEAMCSSYKNIQDAANILRRRHYPRLGGEVYAKGRNGKFHPTLRFGQLDEPKYEMVEVRLTGMPSKDEAFLDWATNELQILADKICSMYWWHEECPIPD